MSTSTPQIVLDHVHIYTANPAASAKWFADSLGAEVVTSPIRIEAKLGGLRVFFEQVSEADAVGAAPTSPHKGYDHLAFAVKDLDALAADMKSKGVVFTREPLTIRPGVRICFIEGPDGISIELLERDAKYT
ncbi:VOC family protein [Tardiphaga sp.]|uniref:VOC family protein n=1 Tax=Tardiphaga sp. TaxID=1926292 RepID=UPI00262D48BD|nr:VOC family protein [Tardiphaga sp.]MDB5619193.1 putative glyoxalase [Tardiphaga sp.]